MSDCQHRQMEDCYGHRVILGKSCVDCGHHEIKGLALDVGFNRAAARLLERGDVPGYFRRAVESLAAARNREEERDG